MRTLALPPAVPHALAPAALKQLPVLPGQLRGALDDGAANAPGRAPIEVQIGDIMLLAQRMGEYDPGDEPPPVDLARMLARGQRSARGRDSGIETAAPAL